MNLITVSGVRGFIDENGTAHLHIEDVARGLGLVEKRQNGVEYIRWGRVNEYLAGFNFATSGENEFIPENIFYLLAMKASNQAAVSFQMKVANEILPSIRKTGSYSLQPKLPQTYSEALRELANVWEENQKLLPKAESFDNFMNGENLQAMNVVAKTLGIGRNKLFDFLRQRKILLANNTPYQEFLDRGYFEVKEKPLTMGDSTINKPQTFATPKGVAYIEKLLKAS